MSGADRRRTARRLLLGAAAAVVAGAAASSVLDGDPDGARGQPAREVPAASAGVSVGGPRTALANAAARSCGPASTTTLAGVYAAVSRGIYAAETRSREVTADRAHITGSRALLSALASNDQGAVYAAVHALVYTPHWHIVRIRVLKAGRTVADVGGPDVIAPLSGALRWRGRTLGTYVMSVQDDAGFVKLVSRFVGIPVNLYKGGSLVMGTLRPPPPSTVSSGATVSVGGVSYRAYVYSARAFPSGTLRVALFVPMPASGLAAASCPAVRRAAWGHVARHIANRFKPLSTHYQALVDVLRGTTGGLAYVRSGSITLAGGAGPARIPSSGVVRYGGHLWSVYSWEPIPPARVYLLTPLA
jgi:hypothetical protein